MLLPKNFLHSVSLATFFQFGKLVSLTIECMWHSKLHSSSGQWWQLALGSLFFLFEQELFLVEGGHQSVPGLGLQRVSPLWRTLFWSHRCVQFMKPFPDPEAEQVCCPWCAVLAIPKTSDVGNVPPGIMPRRFYPALLALPSHRASKVDSAGHLHWISSHWGLLSFAPACLPNAS